MSRKRKGRTIAGLMRGVGCQNGVTLWKHESGFTLVELIIAIVILAILVAIAVPVLLANGKKADHVVAVNNLKAASSAVQAVYFSHIAQNGQEADAFRDYHPPAELAGTMVGGYVPVDGRYMSIQEPKITWVNLSVGGSSAPIASADPTFYAETGGLGFQLVSVWKAGESLASGPDIAKDWNLLNRKVGVVYDKYWDEGTGVWEDNVDAQYLTLVTYELVGVAHYNTIQLGNIVADSSFDWRDGAGAPGEPLVAVNPPSAEPPTTPPVVNPPADTEPTQPTEPATQPTEPATQPTEPSSSPERPPAPAVSDLRIEPETLNLKSNGVFTCFITLSSGYNAEDIDPTSLECFGAKSIRFTIEGNGTLQVKFDRKDLCNVPEGDAVVFVVKGKFKDGTPFEGSDTVRVTHGC